MNATRSTKPPRVHKHTLIEMNVPVYRARRDAALASALEILQRNIENADERRRLTMYARCERLLDEAIHATRRTMLNRDAPILRYLQILRDTVGLNLILLRHAFFLAQETKQLSEIVDTHGEILREIDDGFMCSERQLLHCVANLLQFGEPLLKREADDRLQNLHPDDLRRYDIARGEYDEYYRQAHFTPRATPQFESAKPV